MAIYKWATVTKIEGVDRDHHDVTFMIDNVPVKFWVPFTDEALKGIAVHGRFRLTLEPM